MNDQMNAPMVPPPSGISDWFSVWRDALTKPNEQTFSNMAASPKAKSTTAFLWIFLGALVNFFLASLVQGRLMSQIMRNYNLDTTRFGGGIGAFVIRTICGAPIAAVIAVVGFAIVVGIVQLLARMFGGRGTFDQLSYAFAAIMTPFYLVTGVLTLLSAIPVVGICFGIVGILAGLYILVLELFAVKGVNQFGWGQALGSLLLPVLALCCCLSVGAFAIARAIGPNMPDIFNSFPTPLP